MKLKKKYYLIGIGGVAMASLAGLLKEKGHEVAGSDQEMYEPMKSMLKRLNIRVFSPYNMLHMKRWKPDVVVVGNAISRGNPELEYALSIGQSYRSAPEILSDEFLEDKCPIVITGTHGKTTTTALVAWILEYAGLDPTIFVGGFMRNINSTFKLGKSKYVVLEGDEYDTSFFDKGPKFYHYRPFIGLVNNIEHEHIDIYKDLSALKYVFGRFMNLIPQNGLLAANAEDKNVKNLVKMFRTKHFTPKIKTFGINHGDYTEKRLTEINSNLIGKHNIYNTLGAIAITEFIGIPRSKIKKAIETFEGVKRRTEIILKKNGVVVIDDYAHHPTAVRYTLNAIRSKFHMKPKSGGRLIVAFEPGSASAKRRVFEKQFAKALSVADIVFLYKPFKVTGLKQNEIFNGSLVSHEIKKKYKKPAFYLENIEKLLFQLKQELRSGDILVIMSCRGFDGLRERIGEVL